jgi:hypothetical protein
MNIYIPLVINIKCIMNPGTISRATSAMDHVQIGEAWLKLYLTIKNILLKKVIVLILRTYSSYTCKS